MTDEKEKADYRTRRKLYEDKQPYHESEVESGAVGGIDYVSDGPQVSVAWPDSQFHIVSEFLNKAEPLRDNSYRSSLATCTVKQAEAYSVGFWSCR